MSIREIARAKINLTLSVLGRRPDGYHELESLVTFAAIHDVVTLDPGADGGVAAAGPFAGYIGGENLLIRALAILREIEPRLRLGAVRLHKELPVAAGLGGGSADAAALLRAVRRANPSQSGAVDWLRIAETLGADVPVCLVDQPAFMWGKGERIAPSARLPEVDAVLVNPGLPLSTADVFGALRAGPMRPVEAVPQVPGIVDLYELCAFVRARGNGLEAAAIALRPVIGEIKAVLAAEPDCRLAVMAGSGPTCFGLFPDQETARRAAERIAAAYPAWWVRATSLAGAGRG
jgi:4-diphosphocytidyl-2-C-methyl-D-erythritol kinase